MSTRIRVLTFAWPLPYVRALARTGHAFEVVPRRQHDIDQPWVLARRLPSNALVVDAATALRRAARDSYDLVVCHTFADLAFARPIAARRVMVLHAGPAIPDAVGVGPGAPDEAMGDLLAQAVCVFDGERIRRRWTLAGRVVRPGFDLADYPVGARNRAAILVVGNCLAELGSLAGFDLLGRLSAGLPLLLAGFNPRIGVEADRADDRLRAFAHAQVCLNVSAPANSDHAPLAMLEAMASGVPVVTTPVGDSPVVDGVNGFEQASEARLRCALLELLEDQARARGMGDAARATIAAAYPEEPFLREWQAIIAECARGAQGYDARRTDSPASAA